MRTIATLQDPDSGSIDLDGLNVLTQKNEVRKILGYLPQELGVYPKMSAVEQRRTQRDGRRAGIDPYNKLIDRISEDNMIDVAEL